MEEKRIHKPDRISELPEFIVHHILSFLDSPKDLVRASVLSKKWFALTASFPILDFDLKIFAKATGLSGLSFFVKDKFLEYVAYTLSRFCNQNVSVDTFKLITFYYEPTDIHFIDKWICLILEKNVRNLVLDIQYMPLVFAAKPTPIYSLPHLLLFSPSLTSLTIHHCQLPSSLMVNVMKFKPLKKLSLNSIPLNEQVIKHLTTMCPLLEEFKVESCYGFKRFCVYGLQNLQSLQLYYKHELEMINIEALNLYCLCLLDLEGRGPPSINLVSCNKLTKLYFCGRLDQSSNQFVDFLSNFPFIETLDLYITSPCKNLKFSSRSLSAFELYLNGDLEGIEMDTPNLRLFQYYSRSHKICFHSLSDLGQLKTFMKYYPNDIGDALWFQKLRRSVESKNGLNLLHLHITLDCVDVDDLKVIQSPPLELENIELTLGSIDNLSEYQFIVDAVFCCFRPRALTLRLIDTFIKVEEWSHVVKFIYEKLLQQEDEGQGNMLFGLIPAFEAKKQLLRDLDSLLKALLCERVGPIITFTKEQSLNWIQ